MGPLKYLRLHERPTDDRPLPHTGALDIVNRNGRAFTRDENNDESGILVETGTPVQSKARVITLDNGGSVIHGEVFAIGNWYFEINASDGTTVSNVGASGVKAAGTVTLTGLPSNANTLTVGGTAYDLLTGALTTGDIAIGATAGQTASYIASAINGDENNVAHANVTAEANGSTVVITSKFVGAGGDAVVLTESAANLTVDGSGTIGGTTTGVDPQYYPINVTATATKSQGELTIAAAVTADDTMTIGTKVYTFKVAPTADGEIIIASTTVQQIIDVAAAINGTDGRNTANTHVTAAISTGTTSVITAKIGGEVIGAGLGDSIVTTETFTSGSNVFDAATTGTETGGVDPSAVQFTDAVVTDFGVLNTDIDFPFVATDATADTTITSSVHGADINGFITYESSANIVMVSTTAGVTGTAGQTGTQMQDGSYVYTLVQATPANKDYAWFRAAYSTF